jgi:alanyl-tRNA synthetase
MTSVEIRQKFLDFFEKRGHKVIPSASLVPENDPSVLFTTAGMQQFKPYYTAPENAFRDFGTQNVVSVQKCLRTGDIDEVGDNTHLTFFEMLGNFSFGGYGRKEAIEYAYEFITQEMNLKISYVTIYKGSENVPKDEQSKEIWQSLNVNLEIREEGADVFWGPTGDSGPCGPTTEIYCKNISGEDVEIWNIVFNEYFCDGSREQLDKSEAKLTKLPVLGIDTGMGFERLVSIVQKKESVYETDLFNNQKTREERIIADHLRASEFLILDGVLPANNGRGYVLRRLIRRAVKFSKEPLKTEKEEIKQEAEKFKETLEKGLKEFEKGTDPFILFTTFGFPIELIIELAQEKGIEINLEEFNKKMAGHQKLSQTSSAGMFKGGLVNLNEKTIKLHTAHHLLLAALQAVVSPDIKQKGSNINEERLRLDFICDHKLTEEEKKEVENWVNDKIKRNLKIIRREMLLAEAEKIGAQMEFGAKYPEIVSVYFAEDEKGNIYSKEFCGGPHAENTGDLAISRGPDGNIRKDLVFKIQKEEASSQGIRRIKAILQ